MSEGSIHRFIGTCNRYFNKVRFASVLAAIVPTLVIASCDTGFRCSENPCPRDGEPTAESISECEAQLRDPRCGALAVTFFNCAWDVTFCDSQGRSNISAVEEHCAMEV